LLVNPTMTLPPANNLFMLYIPDSCRDRSQTALYLKFDGEHLVMLLRDNVYEALRRAILSCDLRPGQELREQDLATRFLVSRSPVRDALLRLESERLVTVLPRQGYRVNPISISDARDIFGLRLLIEPACAASAAQAENSDVLDAFRGFAGDEAAFVIYNRAFHSAIANLSGNERMAAIARDLMDQSDRLMLVILRSIDEHDRRHLITEHDAVIDAIRARDSAAAAKFSYDHVRDAETRVLRALETTTTEDRKE
jgi:DNA-binding GntR family transcriptional regulator